MLPSLYSTDSDHGVYGSFAIIYSRFTDGPQVYLIYPPLTVCCSENMPPKTATFRMHSGGHTPAAHCPPTKTAGLPTDTGAVLLTANVLPFLADIHCSGTNCTSYPGSGAAVPICC
jgi:hypothetical protein